MAVMTPRSPPETLSKPSFLIQDVIESPKTMWRVLCLIAKVWM